jgi:hypothetical protein
MHTPGAGERTQLSQIGLAPVATTAIGGDAMNFIDGSVGHNGRNQSSDVAIIQEALNAHVKVPYRAHDVNGRADATLIEAIRSQKSLWRRTVARPVRATKAALATGVREPDGCGDTYEGFLRRGTTESRGNRTHDGVDYVVIAGSQSSRRYRARPRLQPHETGIDAAVLSGLQIEASDGPRMTWYLTPSAGIVGKLVKAGDVLIGEDAPEPISTARLPLLWGQMTDHVHVRLQTRTGVSINCTVIR